MPLSHPAPAPAPSRADLEAKLAALQHDALGHVLSRVARRFHEVALRAVHEAGYDDVRESWIALLRHLEPEGLRSSVLAERLQVTRQAAGQLVSELESRGYLERVPDPSDGRAKLVRMTERGLGAWLAGLEALMGLQRDLAADLGQPNLDALRRQGAALLLALEERHSHSI